MQDIAVQFEKHCWIHSVSLFPPQVHVGRSPIKITFITIFVLKKLKKYRQVIKHMLLFFHTFLG
ncbi:hypothetical protein [Spiroplasma endosymbiont of Apeira syringaria]|uniref:hypothetical protein n=1 Tax=Spiroplasma endosymbiont of Apeira syringaria TaxID=3066307 RepID=UPI0030D4C49C